MAGARATASVSVTIGVALATSVVAGAILLGPSLVACGQGANLGTCLRQKVDPRGVLGAPDAAPQQDHRSMGDAVHRGGWIEANATEYASRPPALAALDGAGPTGNLGAGSSVATPPPAAMADLSPASGQLVAGGAAIAVANAGGAAAPRPPPGQLTASAGATRPGAAAAVALSAPTGTVRVAGLAPSVPVAGEVALASRAGLIAAMGMAQGNAALGGSADALAASSLTAEAEPGTLSAGGAGRTSVGWTGSGQATYVVAATPSATTLQNTRETPEVAPAPPREKPVAKPPAGRVWRADPRYPSVIVLPPPARGRDSSFTTLKLR